MSCLTLHHDCAFQMKQLDPATTINWIPNPQDDTKPFSINKCTQDNFNGVCLCDLVMSCLLGFMFFSME